MIILYETIYVLILLIILLICRTNQGQSITDDINFCPALNLTNDLRQLSGLKSRYAPNEEVHLECINRSQVLIGSSTLRCSGVIKAPQRYMWDSDLPECVEIPCPIPEPPINGDVLFTLLRNDLISVMYSCKDGYTLIGESAQSCLINSFWTSTRPICLVDCSEPLAPPDGGVEKGCFYENCTAAFYCNKGYEISPNDAHMTTCTETGHWNPRTPLCEAVQCTHPGVIENGSMMHLGVHIEHSFRYKTTVYYTCNENYTLIGTRNLTCNAQGQWTGEKPECVFTLPNMSDDPSTAQPVNISTEFVTQETSTEYSTSIYKIFSTIPTQRNPRCSRFPMITFGNGRKYGNVVIYRCDHGYLIQGEDEITCVNGSWVGNLPHCIPITQPKHETTTKTFLWEQVFLNNEHWDGTYEFHKKRHKFAFKRLSVQLQFTGSVTGVFIDSNAKFELEGSQDDSGAIVFQRSKEHVTIETDRFISTYWYVEGKLERKPCVWIYTGKIHSSKQGFGLFTMSSPIVNTYGNEPECGVNVTVIVVGVISAFLVLVMVVIGLLYWAKRNGKLQTGGHKTLTSFENPVYEYEHNINPTSPNPIELENPKVETEY